MFKYTDRLRVYETMRYSLIFLLLLTLGAFAATTQPAATLPTSLTLTEPSADRRFVGRLFTFQRPKSIELIRDIKITNDVNASWAAKKGSRIEPTNFESLFKDSTPLSPDDKLIEEWAFAPWCQATFQLNGRKWSASLFLGGLGILTDDKGCRAAFKFTPPHDDGD